MQWAGPLLRRKLARRALAEPGYAQAVPERFGHYTQAPEVDSELVWVQDEPQNQGAWFQIQHNIMENLSDGQKLAYAGRPASASPAVGYYDKHYAQQKSLIDTAFSKLKGFVLTK